MPNIKSAKKRVITSDKRNEINTAKKARVKTAIKNTTQLSKQATSLLQNNSFPKPFPSSTALSRTVSTKRTRLQERNPLSAALWTHSKQTSKNVLSQHFKRLFENSLFFVERNLRILSHASQLLPLLFFLTRIVATTQTRQTPSAHIAEIDAIVSTPASSFSFLRL